MRRSQGREPQTVDEQFDTRIGDLSRRVGMLEAAGSTTIQAIDTTEYPAPQQGEIAIDHPTPTVKYYHEDEWRDIGGTPPAWCAVYDAFVYGQFIGASAVDLSDIELVWPNGAISTNGAPYFDLVQVSNAEYGIDTYEIRLLKPGLYSFSLQIEWDDPNLAESVVRYSVYDNTDTSNFIFPGRSGGPFGLALSGDGLHKSENFNDWEMMDHVTWSGVPVFGPDRGGSICHLTVGATIMQANPLTPTPDAVFGYKRFWIIRHGDLFWDQVGFPSGLL